MALYTVWYNWCRRHTTTRLTPAQAAGLIYRWHDLEWMVGQVDTIRLGGKSLFSTRRDTMVGAALFAALRARGCRIEQWGDRNRRAAADDVTRERTARRLMVVRLRVRSARLEAEQASESRIGAIRQELRALNSPARDAD